MARDLIVGTILLFGVGAAPAHSADIIPKASWFAAPAIGLRPFLATNQPSVRTAPRPAQASSEKEGFSLQTEKLSAPLEAQLQRYQSMNGRPLLQIAPGKPVSGGAAGFARSTLDLLLPPKGTLFRANPNARRDPLVLDNW
jgi:hypothetical protein